MWCVARQRQHLFDALFATSHVQHHVQYDLLMNVVIRQGSHLFKLSARRAKVGWISFFVLDLSIDSVIETSSCFSNTVSSIMEMKLVKSTFLPLGATEVELTRADPGERLSIARSWKATPLLLSRSRINVGLGNWSLNNLRLSSSFEAT